MQSLLGRVFRQHAGRTAVQGRSITWTYADLDQLSAALAQTLLDRGVTPGQTLPILMGRSPLLVLSQLALVRLGGAYSPIDLASPAPRQRAMLDAIGTALRLTDGAAGTEGPEDDAASLDVAAWLNSPDANRTATDVWIEPPSDCPVYVMFTSGSTGVPKGVMVPHAGVVRLVHDANYAHFGPEQRWSCISSPAFDASTLEVWGALLNGGCCVIQEEAIPSLDTLAEFLIGQRITDTWLTSALFNAMAEDQLASMGRLRQLLIGGERVSARHARLMLQAHPNARLINGYGPTENTTFTLCHTIALVDTEGAAGVPIGTPLSGTQVRVESTDAEFPGRGELWTAGDGVALGYLGDAELTQAKFVWLDGTRWYRTGDLVRERPDGVFEFRGRIDRQIKLRGQRIELEEVELALTSCPGVGNGAVLVVGQSADERRIVASYNWLDSVGPSEGQVAAHMRKTLPEAAIPSQFVRLVQLPANLNGKVDRKALEAMWAGGLPAAAATEDSLVDRLRRIITDHPDRPALEGRDEILSYAELDKRSAELATQLIGLGLQSGDPVALLLPRSVFLVVAVVAVVRAGAVYVPIDPGYPAQRTARLLGALKPKFMLRDGDGGMDPADCRCIDRSEMAALAVPADGTGPWVSVPPAAPLYTMFTSGSTGAPKGVVVPSRGLLALLTDTQIDAWAGFPPDARWLLATSPSFDISNLEIWGALLNGACCVVQEGELPSLDELAHLITARRVSHAQLSTAMFNSMVDTQLGALLGLTQLITGGERASPPHMRKLLLAHPALRLINAYGPTETTIWSLSHQVGIADTHAATGIPIGKPVHGTLARLEAVDIGTAGEAQSAELLIAGAGVALGYLNDAEQTRLKFVERDDQRWYRTGDLVSQRADGVLAFHGRADRQVKLQGQRIELDEVELALASCPDVGEVAVLLRGDDATHRHLVAFYAGLAGAAPDDEQVATHLAAQLPAAAVPRVIRALERLPQNRNGKVDRDALALLADAVDTRSEPVDATTAPRGEFETKLASIWQALLPRARIGRGSHFLRIGGSSLLALHVATQVHKQLGRNLAPVDVLRRPLLADQAELIAQLPILGVEVAIYDRKGGHRMPMTHIQTSLLAASSIDLTDCAYLVHVGLVLPEAPEWSAWRTAFEALARRHPALRLSAFHDGETARGTLEEKLASGWWQEHPPIADLPRDLDWPEAVQAVISRPLDTRTQGSMRVDCWRLHGGGAALVWTVHHHVLDEASINNALVELDALLRGVALAPVYGSPFSFQAVESAWVDRPAAMGQWAARLAETLEDCTPPLERAPALGHERRFEFTAGLQQILKARCEVLGCTPFTLLLTAYGLALQEVFGPKFRFVSTPFSRRAEPELLEPIGYLLDVRFIEAGALPSEAPDQTLARVHQAILEGQEPSFQWLDTLMDAVEKINPQAARCLSQFGFTWRIDPARALPMGGRTAQLLRMPQTGARLSMFLHAAQLGDTLGYSIEAVESAHRNGQVEAVAGAFERQLATLCDPRRSATLLAPTARAAENAARPIEDVALDPALVAIWSRWLKLPEAEVTGSSHFLRSGGSSLIAMRMASELRREHGIKLDVGAFLANATFARLSTLCQEKPPVKPDGYVLVGPADFARVMLLVPGSGGHAAALYALADELRAGLPPGSAVAIVDLDAALHSAPTDDPMWFISRRIVQVVRDLGQARVTAIVGYSLGGAIALRVTEALPADPPLPVWLLDTFAPRTTRLSLWRRLERRVAWMLFGGKPDDEEPSVSSNVIQNALPLSATAEQWRALGEQLGASTLAAPHASVQLIQARMSVKHCGLLWQRRNNGFLPRRYASWSVHEIDGAHLDLPRHLAATTARIIVAHAQRGASVGT